MSIIKTARLKAKIVKIGLAGRVLILASVFVFKYNGYFRHDTFRELLYIMLPLATFYGTLFLKYIVAMAYKIPVGQAHVNEAPEKISFGYYGLLLLNLAELSFISYNAVAGDNIKPLYADNFILYILSLEVAFGLLAGLYIAQLFGGQGTAVINTKDPK